MPAAALRLGGISFSALRYELPDYLGQQGSQALPPVEFVMTLTENSMASEPALGLISEERGEAAIFDSASRH
ncbi:MAG: hypothetical protein ACYC6G_06465 [Desulfobaccales bacterium]